MFQDLRMSLPDVLNWGSWSPDLTHSIILRYLAADTDILRRPRSSFFDPQAQFDAEPCHSCHHRCFCAH
ncbi:hypothetical protein BDP27DRAFT_289746 [Rhodocollybia butyracea]|uniref:Uncharacterized protein n=1 Tax=Rhodocollybia butyracea TaxID=206335 RepID=A0A9P5PI31_9AGAR|nr:hypothetical protein BDP27DRAFT_289746 [Rhodocollybia butyracea]